MEARYPMHKQITLTCAQCREQFTYQALLTQCPGCGHDWLEAQYDLPAAVEQWAASAGRRSPGMWRYWELLPLFDRANIVTMGEGFTPLLPLANLGLMLGYGRVFIKDERQGPTGSFKDRQAALVMSVCKENNLDEMVVASTGNVAISYAAYAARAGVKLWAFLTSAVPQDKMREITLYGSEVIKVTGTYDKTRHVAAQFARQKGFFFDQGPRNIVAKESMKTLAYEIAEQLGAELDPGRPFVAPDWYIQAVSGGLGPLGVWKGFAELKAMGMIDRIPKMAVIQPEGCAPMVQSFRQGLETVRSVDQPSTFIATLATGSPGVAYDHLRQIMLNHGGHMETVSDADAYRAMHVMAQMDGISMETAAAVACAGFLKMVNQQLIHPDETVVINCSGHTFPVEKHLLDESRVQKLTLSPSTEPDISSQEGLWLALHNLDERVKQVAILEDDPDAIRLLRRILQARGNYRLLEARNGKAGFALIRQNQPDLVLLDLMMPELDGFAVLELMKADEQLKHIPVIVITAKDLTATDRQRLYGHVEALLEKGDFMEDDLVEGIVDVLER